MDALRQSMEAKRGGAKPSGVQRRRRKKRPGPLSREGREGRGDLSLVAGTFDMDFEAKCTRCFIQVPWLIVEEGIVGIEQCGDQIDLGGDFVQQA
jgi:hypothetical protein